MICLKIKNYNEQELRTLIGVLRKAGMHICVDLRTEQCGQCRNKKVCDDIDRAIYFALDKLKEIQKEGS